MMTLQFDAAVALAARSVVDLVFVAGPQAQRQIKHKSVINPAA